MCIYVIAIVAGVQLEILQGRGDFAKLWHFDKYLVENSRKKGPTGEISDFFFLDTLKTTF